MYPIHFERIYHQYIWGNEFWELSDRFEGLSVVANGPMKGSTLQDLVALWKEKLLGEGRFCTRFPLLVKTIDAQESLSLQVHPDEEKAALFQAEPKNEAWIILKNTAVYTGFKRGVAQSCVLEAIHKNTLKDLIELKTVQSGDALYIPAGTVHAIGGGSLLWEIQQNSNTTYRLYDWGRSSRELHLEKAMASINWNQNLETKIIPHTMQEDVHHQMQFLVNCPYFVMDRIKIKDRWNMPVERTTFQILFCQQGEGIMIADGHRESLLERKTYLIPAAIQNLRIEGICDLIRVKLS